MPGCGCGQNEPSRNNLAAHKRHLQRWPLDAAARSSLPCCRCRLRSFAVHCTRTRFAQFCLWFSFALRLPYLPLDYAWVTPILAPHSSPAVPAVFCLSLPPTLPPLRIPARTATAHALAHATASAPSLYAFAAFAHTCYHALPPPTWTYASLALDAVWHTFITIVIGSRMNASLRLRSYALLSARPRSRRHLSVSYRTYVYRTLAARITLWFIT